MGAPGGEKSKPGSLVVTEFSASDNSLNPEQSTVVFLQLENRHLNPIQLEKPELYNLGDLEVKDTSCEAEEVRERVEGVPGTYSCTWTIEAPDSSGLGAIDSRSYSFSASIQYDSSLQLGSGIPVEFQKRENIRSAGKKNFRFSNGEVSLSGEYDSPMPESGGDVEFRLSKNGKGRVIQEEGETAYEVEYRPSDIIDSSDDKCPKNLEKPAVGNTIEFECRVSSEVTGPSLTEQLTLTIFYKHALAPSEDVRVTQ